ncbi:MAG: pilus assembly protein PilP [bacterium]
MMSVSRSTYIILMLAALLTISLSGCESKDDLQSYIEGVKKRTPVDPPPIPEMAAYTPYTYPGHTRDPFDAKIVAPKTQTRQVNVGNASIDPNRVKEYLENYPLDTLNMVGTLRQGDILWALIQTADGTVQRVKKGNYLGKNYGKVTEVTPTRVNLIEVVPDGFGGFMENPTSIAITSH